VADFDGPLRVVTTVPESSVDRVKPGLPVRILASNASRKSTFSGTVESVAPLPNPTTKLADGSKAYTVRIAIAEKHSELRPGKSASVSIIMRLLADLHRADDWR
jgi:multidrug resistance efflux pump